QISAILRSQSSRVEGVIVTLLQASFAACTHPQKIRERKPLVTKSVSHSLFKKSLQLDTQKTIRQKKKSSSSASLSCKTISMKQAFCTKELSRKAAHFGAQVTVDRPMPGVNISRVRMKIKRAKKVLPPPLPVENGMSRSTSVESESAYRQAARQAPKHIDGVMDPVWARLGTSLGYF
ncbi:hypothetical protein GCK32_016409, partial [Trichostrongylus colubriformis]